MATHLFIAPAVAGKTTYVLTRARAAAQGLTAVPRVVVPTHLQARAARRRLAEMGGAIGVRVLTFDRVYAEVLNAAGEIYTELSEPVQFRLMRAVVEDLALKHYASLTSRPGFAEVLERLIGELKAARIYPDDFARVAYSMGNQACLTELAQIYTAYQARLQEQGWADRAGLAWLAVEALEQRAPQVACDWPLLAVDGFDERGVPLGVPAGPEATALLGKLRRFVIRLKPPENGSTRDFVAWLEQVIGEDPALGSPFRAAADGPTSLGVISNARRGLASIADLDGAALRGLKDRAGVTLVGIQFAVFPPAIGGLVCDVNLTDMSD